MNHILFTTGIPNDFIDIHLPVAKPMYAVVYIYGYRQFSKGARQISLADMAEVFDISSERVRAIWEYWQNLGLVEIVADKGDVLELAFIAESGRTQAATAKPTPPPADDEFEKYSLEEVEQRLYDPEIKRLFFTAHHVTGNPLNDVERRMYLSFYEHYGLPVDVISVMLEYCVDRNKLHNNFLRTVAKDWSGKQLFTVEAAEEYIHLFNNEYRQILSFMGISGRDPIDKEIEFMHKWLKSDGFSPDIIKLACERTIMNKATPNFAYTDGILNKWKADNIHTAEQIAALEAEYYDTVKATRRSKKKKEGTRFQNYKGREWDYGKLAQLNEEFLDKKIAE